jgi:hypothetical protein
MHLIWFDFFDVAKQQCSANSIYVASVIEQKVGILVLSAFSFCLNACLVFTP